MVFLPAERFIVTIIAVLASLDVVLLSWKGVGFDVAGYAALVACGASAIAIGQFYRHVRPNEGIAATATAAGLFVLFTIVGSVFNYLLLPLLFHPVDPVLARIDEQLGFHWPSFVTWASQYPRAGMLLQAVYATSLPQLLAILFFLGFSGRIRLLHHFLLTGVIGALLAIVCWSFFPSFGASSIYRLPKDVTDAVPLAVGPDYGAQLVELGRHSATYLSPKNVLGLIGFPSFHTVMAAMSACFLLRFGLLAVPFLIVNALMVPAILIQGGHNLADVIGGLAVFAIAYRLAGAALSQCETLEARLPRKVATGSKP
jgi:hypothetical protein